MAADDFKDRFLRGVRQHKQMLLRYIDNSYAKVENAVESLWAEQDSNSFLKKIEQTKLIIGECDDKFLKMIDILTVGTDSDKLVQNPSPVPLIISPCSVVYGKQYPVELLHSGSPSNFWLKFTSVSLKALEDGLSKCYNSSNPVDEIPLEGDFVVCLHDGKFRRAKVIKIEKVNGKSEDIKILLVDYGRIICVSREALYPLCEEFCKEPAIGLSCSIHSIKPVGDGWPPETAVSFVSYLYGNQNNSLIAVFHPVCDNQRSTSPFSPSTADFSVTLFMKKLSEASDHVVDIGSQLVCNGLARKANDEVKSSSLEETRSLSPVSDSNFVSVRSGSKSDHSISTEECSNFSNSTQKPSEEPVNNSQPVMKREKSSTDLNPDAFEFKPNSLPTYLRAASPEMEKQSGHFQTPVCSYSSQSLKRNIPNSVTIAASPMAINLQGFYAPNTTCLTTTVIPLVPNIHGTLLYPRQPFSVPSIMPNHLYSTKKREVDVDDLILQPKEQVAKHFYGRQPDQLLMERFLNSQKDIAARSCYEDIEVDRRSTLTTTSQLTDLTSVSRYRPANAPSKLNEVETILKPSQYLKGIPHQIKVFINHINSPSDFYVLIVDDVVNYLERLVFLLNKTYKNSQPIPYLEPKVGSFWVVFDAEENLWARAQVIDSFPNKPVRIRFVDNGAESSILICHFRYMVKEVADIPCLAVPCRLDGIYPSANRENRVWPEEATKKFKDLVGVDHAITALPCSPKDREERLNLVLLIDDDFNKLTVNELLVECGLAVSDGSSSEKLAESIENARFDLWNPMAEHLYSASNNVALDTENYDSASRGYIPQDEKHVCRFFRTLGNCYKGQKCQQLHVIPSKNAFTLDKVESFASLPELPTPNPGSVLILQVSCIIEPFRFYAIFPHGMKDLISKKNRADNSDENETLETLQDSLQQEYNSNCSRHRFTVPPSDSELVIIRSTVDKKWYRGRIVGLTKDTLFSVFLLDFGTTETISLHHICKPLPQFLHYPAQAVECILHGIDMNPKCAPEIATKVFQSLVEERDLVAKIVEVVPHISVTLFNVDDNKHTNINQELIRQNVANPKLNKPIGNSSFIRVPG